MKIKENAKNKILWGLFLLSCPFLASVVIQEVILKEVPVSTPGFFILLIPAFVLFLHAVWKVGYLRGLFIFLTASLLGFISEVLGIRYGIIFGGHYFYQNFNYIICNVPLAVIIYWAAFIYMGYAVVSSFLIWTGKEKPCQDKENVLLLLLLILFDGLVVAAIDLFMDPLQVKAGNWIWLKEGSCFGTPVTNFIGWFLVTIIATGIFRIFEYFWPKKISNVGRSVFLIPVILYGQFWLTFFILALKNQIQSLAMISLFTMFPVFIINLMLFGYWLNKQRQRINFLD